MYEYLYSWYNRSINKGNTMFVAILGRALYVALGIVIGVMLVINGVL